MKWPIYDQGICCGELEGQTQGLYMTFEGICQGEEHIFYDVILLGEQGELSLGIPEWTGRELHLKKTVPYRKFQNIGKCIGGQLRKRGETDDLLRKQWIRLKQPEYFFAHPRRELAEKKDCYWFPLERGRLLAVPCGAEKPFPLLPYFCFAEIRSFQGKRFAVFSFDEEEQPRMIS